MEVTNVKDHVTNATIGFDKVEEMGIDNSPEFFHILSSSLYKYQTLAMVREVLSNAVDAHTDANIADPVEVYVQDGKFIVKDKGTGIEPDMIKPIYGTYGSGTKRDDSNAIGGFGLGCKSPFAYTDNFEVTSSYAGTKTIYRMSKGSKISNGKPSIITMMSVPCGDETGITVTIPIKDNDHYSIAKMVKAIVYLGELNVSLNEPDNTLPTLSMGMEAGTYLYTRDGDVYNSISDIGNLSGTVSFVRYANILYPLPTVSSDTPDDYAEAYRRVVDIQRTLNTHKFIVQAAPNTLSVQPSREGLTETDFTYVSLTKLLEGVIEDITKRIRILKVEKIQAIHKNIKESDMDVKSLSPYSKLLTNSLKANKEDPLNSTLVHFINCEQLTTSEEANTYATYREKTKEVLGIGKDFGYLYDRYTDKHIRRQRTVTWSLERILFKWYRKLFTPLIEHKRVYAYCTERYQSTRSYNAMDREICPIGDLCLTRPHYLHAFKDRNVILTTNKRKTPERIDAYNRYYKDKSDIEGALIYHVRSGKESINRAKEALESTGYTVFDFTVTLPWEKVESTGSSQPTKPRTLSPRVKVTKDSIPTLSSILGSSRIDTRLSTTSDAKRIEKPDAVLLVRINQQTPTHTLDGFRTNSFITKLIEYHGDRIGIVGTSPQLDKWKPANPIHPYMMMLETLKAEYPKYKKEIALWHSTKPSVLRSHINNKGLRGYTAFNFYKVLLDSDNTNFLPFKVYKLSKEAKEFIDLLDVVKDETRSHYCSNERKVLQEYAYTLIPEAVPSEAMVKFFTQYLEYPALDLLNLSNLDAVWSPEETNLVKYLITQVRKVKV